VAYLKLALGLLKIANGLMDWAERERHLKEGERRAYDKAIQEHANRIEQAKEARESVAVDVLPDNAAELPDDGFRRD